MGFSAVDGVLKCQAGITLQAVQDVARQRPLAGLLDPTARGSRTIGGNVAAAFIAQCEHDIGLSAAALVRHGGSISAGHGIGLVKRMTCGVRAMQRKSS